MRAIGDPKDFWSGVFFIAFGAAAIYFAWQHPLGTAMRMGPGAFPVLIGGLLILIGIATLVRAFFRSGEPIERITFIRPGLILLSVIVFALLLAPLGVIGATVALVLIGSAASQKFRVSSALALGLGLGLGSAAVFGWALGLPIPILGAWLGG